MFRPSPGDRKFLTIGQLVRAFQGDKRVRTYGLNLTPTDLDVLRFVFNSGAPEGGWHRWRVYGSSKTLAQSMGQWLKLATPHVHVSLARLHELLLLRVVDREVWTTEWMHEIGAEMLWCDLLSNACPDDFDMRLLDWYTTSRDADQVFDARKQLDPKKAGDRREVMLAVTGEVQRRCTSD
jgi:hypothetical protein